MATSIGEEGLDFPACSVVIRYDRSGRATAPGAVRPPRRHRVRVVPPCHLRRPCRSEAVSCDSPLVSHPRYQKSSFTGISDSDTSKAVHCQSTGTPVTRKAGGR